MRRLLPQGGSVLANSERVTVGRGLSFTGGALDASARGVRLLVAGDARPLTTWLPSRVPEPPHSDAHPAFVSLAGRVSTRSLRSGSGSRRRGDDKNSRGEGAASKTQAWEEPGPKGPRVPLSAKEAAEAQRAARERAVLKRLKEPMAMLEKLASGDVEAAVKAAKKRRGVGGEDVKEEDLDLLLSELQEGMNLEPGLLNREDLLEFQKMAALTGKGKGGSGSGKEAAAAAAVADELGDIDIDEGFVSDGAFDGGGKESDDEWERAMKEGQAELKRLTSGTREAREAKRRRRAVVGDAPAAAVAQAAREAAAALEAPPQPISPKIATRTPAAPVPAAAAAPAPQPPAPSKAAVVADSDDDEVLRVPSKGKPVDPVWGLWSMPAASAPPPSTSPPAAAPSPRAVADSILGSLGELDASRASVSALEHAESDAKGLTTADLSLQSVQQPPPPKPAGREARRGARRSAPAAASAAPPVVEPAPEEDSDIVDIVDVVAPPSASRAAAAARASLVEVVVPDVVPPGTPLTSDPRALAKHKREVRDQLVQASPAAAEDGLAVPSSLPSALSPADGEAGSSVLAGRGLDPATRAARARARAVASSGYAPLAGNASDTLSEEVDAGGSEEVASDGKTLLSPAWEGLLPPEADAHDPDTSRGRRIRSRARRRIEEHESALISAGRGNPGVVPSNATPSAMARAARAATALPMPAAWDDSDEVAERLGSDEEAALRDSGFLVFSEGEAAGTTSEEEEAIQTQHAAMLAKVRAAEAEAMRQDAAAASRSARLPAPGAGGRAAAPAMLGAGGSGDVTALASSAGSSAPALVQLPVGGDATAARGAAASQFLARSLTLSPGHIQALLTDGAADADGAVAAAAAAIQTALAHATPLEAVTGSASGPRPESHLSPLARLDVLRGVELKDEAFGAMLSKAFPPEEEAALEKAFTDPERWRAPELAAYQASIKELRRRSELVRAVRTVLRAQGSLEGGSEAGAPALAPDARAVLARRLVEVAVRSQRVTGEDGDAAGALATAATAGSSDSPGAITASASSASRSGGGLVSPSQIADAIVMAGGSSSGGALPPGTPDPVGTLAAMMGVDGAVLQRQLASIPDGLSGGAVLAPQSLDGGGIPLANLRREDFLAPKAGPDGLAAQKRHMLRGGDVAETLSEGEEAEVQAMLEELGYWHRDLPVKEREKAAAAAKAGRPAALSQEERARAKAEAAEHVATVERLKAAGDGEALARYLLKRAESGAGEEVDADALRAAAVGGGSGLSSAADRRGALTGGRGGAGAEDGLAALEADSDAETEALLEAEVKAAGGRSLIPAGYRNWTEVLAAHSHRPKREAAAEAALKREQQAKLRAAIAPAPPPGGKEPSRRQLAVGANLQRVIEGVLLRRALRDPALYPGGLPLEIAEVAVTPDLRTAYVRWSLPFPVMDTRPLSGTPRDEAVAILEEEGEEAGNGGIASSKGGVPGGSAHAALVALMQRNRKDRGLARIAAASMGGKKAAKQLVMMTAPGGGAGLAGGSGGSRITAPAGGRAPAPQAEDPEVAAMRRFFASQGLELPPEANERSGAATGSAATSGRRASSVSALVSDPVAALYSRLPGGGGGGGAAAASSSAASSRVPSFGNSLLDVDPMLALYHQPKVRLTPKGVADRFYGRDAEVGHLSPAVRKVVATVTAALERNAGEIRRLVGQGLAMRYLPKLEWHRYVPAEELGGLERTFSALEEAQAALGGDDDEEEEEEVAPPRKKQPAAGGSKPKASDKAAGGMFTFEDEAESGRLVAMREPGAGRRGGNGTGVAAGGRRASRRGGASGSPWGDDDN